MIFFLSILRNVETVIKVILNRNLQNLDTMLNTKMFCSNS